MNFFGRKIEGFAQWLVFLVAVLIVAGGLCGVQWVVATGSGSGSNALVGLFMILGGLEIVVMVLALLGILFVVIAWPVTAISRLLNARNSKPPKDATLHLFSESQEEETKNESLHETGESEDR